MQCGCVPYANQEKWQQRKAQNAQESPKCSVPSHIYVSGSFADLMAKKKYGKDILIEQQSMKGLKKTKKRN